MTTDRASFLQIDGIHKSFGAVEVLHDINIELEEGGFLVLVGPSGCGKSTLLNLIAGFESASRGDIRLGERSIMGLHPSQRDIAMVFQSYALYPNMSVADNIGFGMETRGVPKPTRQQKINEVAEMLQISQLLKRKPSQLSGGQRQRVAMGRALVRDPRVFLFDEPLSNLDARLRVDMRAEIKKLHNRLGTSIVYVTHDQIEAMTLATRIAVLDQGHVLQCGSPDDIYNSPANEFVADFMGSPAMNKIPVTLNPQGESIEIHVAGQRLRLEAPAVALQQSASHGTGVTMGIRSEDVAVSAGDATAQDNTLTLSVGLVEPTGSDTFITAQGQAVSIVSRVSNDIKPAVGETIALTLDLNKVHFFSSDSGQRIG